MGRKMYEKAMRNLRHSVSILTVENIRLKDENKELSRYNNIMRTLMQCDAKQHAVESHRRNSSDPVSL
jgi:hypothetical protein